jgi:hypothetical protein
MVSQRICGVSTQLWISGMNSSIKPLGGVFCSTLGCMYLPKKSSHRWWEFGFPIAIYPNSNGGLDTKPREKSGRVSLVPEDIHNRQLYTWTKIWSNRAINDPMVSMDHCWHESSQVLVRRQRLHLFDKKRHCYRLNHQSTIQDFGTRNQCYTEMLCVLVTLSMRVTGVTTPRLNKAAGNTGMDHRYHNTSINPWCTKHNQGCITTSSNTLISIAVT